MKKLNDSIEYYLKELLSLTDQKIYLVGGFIRERLMGKPSFDFDFTIESNTLDICQKLAKKTKGVFVLLDKERETGRVVWNKIPEIKELSFDIAKTFDCIKNDLQIRDLTINALAVEVKNENIHKVIDKNYLFKKEEVTDFSNGYDDLIINKLIRTYKKENLKSDPLRILRTFRFLAKFSFSLEEKTKSYIQEFAYLIEKPAKERVLKELKEIFSVIKPYETISLMNDSNIFDYLTGENDYSIFINKIKKIDSLLISLNDHFHNYLEIELFINKGFSSYLNKSGAIKLAILFNYCTSNSKSLKKLLETFTFSKVEQKLIIHYSERTPTEQELINMNLNDADIYSLFQSLGDETIGILIISFALTEKNNLREKIKILLEKYFSNPLLSKPPNLISGNDLISNFNLKPSPKIKELLDIVKKATAEGKIKNYSQAIDYINKFV